MTRTMLGLSLALLMAVIFSVLLMVHDQDWLHHLVSSPKQKNSLTAYVSQLKVLSFNKNGQLQSTLEVKHLTRFSDQRDQLTQPKLIISSAQKAPWVISSERGVSLNNGKIVRLTGHVTLQQTTTQITTPQLTYYPKKEYAENNAPVTIKRADMMLAGVGVMANFKTNVFTIKSNAKGSYKKNV